MIFVYRKTKSALFKLALLAFLTLAGSWPAAAATTLLTPATGGSAISADDFSSGTWTLLAGPVMTETGSGAIANTLGTIILNLPADYEFRTGVPVSVLVSGSATATANINDIANNGTIPASVTASNVTITITAKSAAANVLTWQNLQVRAKSGTPLGSTNITLGGTAVSKGLSAGANCGTLTKVAGAATQLAFGVQPGNRAAATLFTPAITVQIRDQFGNLTTNASVVTIGIGNNPGGGALSGTTNVNAVNGTASPCGRR